MKKHELEKYYTSDEHWNRFVNFYSKGWDDFNSKEELLKSLDYNLDISKVTYGIFGNDCFNWVNNIVPLLDGLKPSECVFDEKLKIRLKSLLLRMPK